MVRVKVMVFNATFNNIFSYIVAVCFLGGGNGVPEKNHDLPQLLRKI
jgi:hypothetical protein